MEIYGIEACNRDDGCSIEGSTLYRKKEEAIAALESLNLEDYTKMSDEYYLHTSGHKTLTITPFTLKE